MPSSLGGGPKRRPLPSASGGGGGGNNGSSSNGNNESPSSIRRSTLRKIAEEPIKQYSNLSNLCPIDRYYVIGEKLLEAFTTSFELSELDEAYVYGIRYVNFVLKVLPQHNYYNLTQNRSKKKESLQNGTHVMDALEEIKKLMDEEEILRERERTAKLRQLPLEERLKMLQSSSKAVVMAEQQQQQKRQQQKEEEERLRAKFQQRQQQKVVSSSPPPPIMGGSVPPPPPIPPPPTTAPPLPSSSAGAAAVVTPEPSSEEETFLKYLFITIQMDSDDSIFSNNGSNDEADSSDDDYLVKTGQALKESQDILNGRQPSEDDEDDQSVSINGTKSNSTTTVDDNDDPVAPAYSLQETIRNMKLIISKTKTSGGESGTNKSSISNGSSLSHSPEDVCSDMSMERLQKIYGAVYRQWLYMPIICDINVSNSSRQIEVTASCRQNQISISHLKTYQGRFDNSVNGCTVIAPLCVAQHLYSSSSQNIINKDIEHVIDKDCPPILSKIRTKLGLPKHALIIPSDVHDYLLDHKILRQEDFVGACGGNIFDYNHLSELLKMLCYGSSSETQQSQSWIPSAKEKVGVALFFHEHVVSIVKCFDDKASNAVITFDLIDSLPSGSGQGAATRTKCYTIQALEVCLRHYASSKLTPADRHFINNNVWSDELCDFDPRVFQAFVWSTK